MHFANRPLLIHVEKQEGGGSESILQMQHNTSKRSKTPKEATVAIIQV